MMMRVPDTLPVSARDCGETAQTTPADRLASTDGAAFAGELYACHGTALMRLALHLTRGDRHRAEDLMQEVIARAWCRRDSIRHGEVRAWLAVTARHLAVDWHRRQVHSAAREQANAQSLLTADDLADQVTSAVIARAAVAALPPHHRAVIICLYWAGCTTGETAAALGIPAGTVKSRAFHALAALRASLAGSARMDGTGRDIPGGRPPHTPPRISRGVKAAAAA
jgi:RNA polymerase sigma-70 factor (ECF subfamily)